MLSQSRRSSSFLAQIFAAAALSCALATLIGLVGFLANTLISRTIDVGPSRAPLSAGLIDALLILAFGVQHSLMARTGFKQWASRCVPCAYERSAYILASAFAVFLLIACWRPLPTVVWALDSSPARACAWTLFVLGWATMLVSTIELDPLEFAGLRQAREAVRGAPRPAPMFRVRGLHRFVRHPTYAGWLLASWSTPSMSAGHVLFAALTSIYVSLAINLEERDLVRVHGEAYKDYRRRVPCLVPWKLGFHARVEPLK